MEPKTAVIARVDAHRPFKDRGLKEINVLLPKTSFGDANPIHVFESPSGPFAVLSRHGEQGYEVSAPYVNDKANIWALRLLGVEKIISWSAPGAIDPGIAPGDLVVPHDVLEWGGGPPATFFEGRGQGVVRSSPVFCPELRAAFLTTLAGFDFRVHQTGVYAATRGPRLETATEVAALGRMGATLVGMTLAPEIWLARELEFCYAAVCCSVNYAEGVKDRPFKPAVLFEGLATEDEERAVARAEEAFADIALALLPVVAATPRRCHCPAILERYRRRGDLREGWWRWL